jgi:hypothetical protein
MSAKKIEVGNKVAFPGGKGKVVDVDKFSEKNLIKIKTLSSKIRVMPSNLDCIKTI